MAQTPAFPALLRKAMEAAGISQRAFAEALSMSPGFPPLLLAGKRTPPPEKIERMIKVLKLSESDAYEFRNSAAAAHVPRDLRGRVEHLERMERNLAALASELVSLTLADGTAKDQILDLIERGVAGLSSESQVREAVAAALSGQHR